MKSWATQADSGRPMAPPTPRVALIEAIAVPVMCGGVTSRIRLMPTGMKPIARPCRVRPTSIGVSESESAQMTEPTSSTAALTESTRCLPNMSASRPATGIATAAPSRVAVITQEALAADVCSSCGSSPWMGRTRVCISEALRPPKHRTITVISALEDSGTGASGSAGVD